MQDHGYKGKPVRFYCFFIHVHSLIVFVEKDDSGPLWIFNRDLIHVFCGILLLDSCEILVLSVFMRNREKPLRNRKPFRLLKIMGAEEIRRFGAFLESGLGLE